MWSSDSLLKRSNLVFAIPFQVYFNASRMLEKKTTIFHSLSITSMKVQEKQAENDKKTTRKKDYGVTICNKPSYYIYWRIFIK